jgi:hypothetical protein
VEIEDNLRKTRAVVDKEKFDGALNALLRKSPLPRKEIKTEGKRSSKTPILAK